MSASEHKQHYWVTRYVTYEGRDMASGMRCECGAVLHQDQVQDALNNSDLSNVGLLLAPCPFCKDGETIKTIQGIETGIWIVHCSKCSTQTGLYIHKQHAVAAWNNRAGIYDADYIPEIVIIGTCIKCLTPDLTKIEFIVSHRMWRKHWCACGCYLPAVGRG